MYSSYYVPKDGRQSTVLTDHEALHRDEATHKNIQSDESVLRPIDLETIMSSKAAVKFWYLHRPKTMEYVHKNATKIQSLGRAFAVRQLRKKHGAEYVVALAKADAKKKEAEKMAELSEEERTAAIAAQAEYDARVEESRRLRREQEERERREEEELRAKLAEEERLRREEEERRLEEERLQREEEERLQREEEERIAAEEAARKLAEEEEAARLEAIRKAEEEEAERIRQEEEEAARLQAIAEAEAAEAARIAAEEEAARIEAERQEQERLAAIEAEKAEKERARIAAAEAKERARQEKLEAEKKARYEESLSKDVPVVVDNHGPGRVEAYDAEGDTYTVKLEQAVGGLRITVKASDVELDDDRILSPRTKVDTPFGTGEVVGLDPHVGCYAINTEVHAADGEQFLAFVQIKDVAVHEEEVEERAIVENPSMPIPDEIGLVSARIVDSRVVNKTGKRFIQYKLEIKTTNYGTVYCWKRYSTFRSLCERLTKEAGYAKKEIPELPKRHITGNFSQKTIGERAEKLNHFLNAAVTAEHLQWGIRVDDQIAVYKRRVKKPGDPSSMSKRTQGGSSRSLFSSRRR